MFLPDKFVTDLFDKAIRLLPDPATKFLWTQWFAWRPVYCSRGEDIGIVWLEPIFRMKTDFRTVYRRK